MVHIIFWFCGTVLFPRFAMQVLQDGVSQQVQVEVAHLLPAHLQTSSRLLPRQPENLPYLQEK